MCLRFSTLIVVNFDDKNFDSKHNFVGRITVRTSGNFGLAHVSALCLSGNCLRNGNRMLLFLPSNCVLRYYIYRFMHLHLSKWSIQKQKMKNENEKVIIVLSTHV